MSENNTITEAVDKITIKNIGKRTLDSVKLIISAGLDRTLGLSENSFRTIEPNSEVTVDLRFKAAIGEKKAEFMQNYVGELTVVSEHHNVRTIPIHIEWKEVESKHFTIYARSGNEEIAKQLTDFLEANYQKITSRFGEMSSKTVIYMTHNIDEMKLVNPSGHPYYSYADDTIFICGCDNTSYNAVKEFIYRLAIANNFAYYNTEKIILDKENWLVDGVASYVASKITDTGMSKKYIDAFVNNPAGFQWYGYGSEPQYGATYTFLEFLKDRYGNGVIDRTLHYLASGMISNHRCSAFEECVILQAVYDVTGLSMDNKRYTLSFKNLVEEWEEYVKHNYHITQEGYANV